jgi:Ca2+:H+ antiporter
MLKARQNGKPAGIGTRSVTTSGVNSPNKDQNPTLASTLGSEWLLLLSFATTALYLMFGKAWMANIDQVPWFIFILVSLFGVILSSAFAIVRHAESLAVKLGEPFGTLVLTLAVIGIEVMMISAVMLTGENKPTVARDTMFAVVMIILNGMVGLSLLLGGLRHHEQTYNFYGTNAFLALIVPLSVLGLVLPNFTTSTSGPTLSTAQAIFLSIMSIGLYGVFLASQTSRHREYFVAPEDIGKDVIHDHGDHPVHSVPHHSVLLVLYMLPLVILAKQLAIPIDYGVKVMGAPKALGGLIVAIVILSPEAMSATKAAMNNQLQRSVNILLGSVLATIGLTIPAVLTIGLFTQKTVELGLSNVDMVLLVLTLAISNLTFNGNRTNMLLGAIHLLMFFSFLTLIFES